MMEAGLLPLLHRLSSPHLQTIYLEINVGTGHLDLPWGKVDAALGTFSDLREVLFDLYGLFDVWRDRNILVTDDLYPSYGELCECMRRQMKRSDSRGVLKFMCAGGAPS